MPTRVLAAYRDAYSGLPRAAWLLACAEFVNRTGTMVFFFMTLYLSQKLRFTLPQVAQVMTAYGLGSLVGSYLGGRLCDAIGAYRVQKASLAFGGTLLIALSYPTTPAALTALMFILAATSESLHPANTTAISLICPPEIRAKGFALARLATNLGISIGPVVGGYLALLDYDYLFWVDGLTSLIAAVLVSIFFRTPGPHREAGGEARAEPPRSPWRDIVFLYLMFASFAIGLIYAQLINTFPLYMRSSYGLAENRIGQLIAVNTVIIVLLEMLLIHRLSGTNPAKVVAVGSLSLGAGYALMPFGTSYPYAVFTVVVWTVGEMLTLPLLVTMAAGRADESSHGRYQGLLSLSFASSMVAGPAAGLWIYQSLGSDRLWYSCGLAGLVLFAGFMIISRTVSPAAGETATS